MVLKTIFFVLLTAPALSWGFSPELAQDYIKKSQNLKISENAQWLRLGHYRSTWSGPESPLRGNFFLSGVSDNPNRELEKTLELFFSNEDMAKTHQCRYLARRTWLQRVLEIPSEDLVPCPEKMKWKADLGASELYIVFAASDLNSAGSSFGHTFLRAHNPKNTKNLEILDYGINYAAITSKDNAALYALKGLFGFYPGAYSMLPFYQKMKEYTNLEGRNLWEYKLNLAPAQVEFLIDHLLELEGSYAPYYFTNDNCSQQILELLEVVYPAKKFSQKIKDFVIPLDTVKVLKEQGLLSDEKMRLSLQAEWQERYAQLNTKQIQILKKNMRKTADPTANSALLSKKENAQVLEATLSYMAIQEYRGLGDFKDEKYKLSVARAQLGAITEPILIPFPTSPLESAPSMRSYLGIGSLDGNNYFDFKWRRAFHDLLSKEAGLAPFSHLEIISFNFRYFVESKNLDLQKFVFLKMISTSPLTLLETPWSWKLDIGTQPKLAPYFNFGAGFSVDSEFLARSRFSAMAISENSLLFEEAKPEVGAELTWMVNHQRFRSLASVKNLSDLQMGRNYFSYEIGIGFDIWELETQVRFAQIQDTPHVQALIVF